MADVPDPDGFPALLALYLEDCAARGQTERTVAGKLSSLRAFVAWCLAAGLARPRDVGDVHMEEYRRYLSRYRQPVREAPLGIATQRNHLTHIKGFFARLRRLHRLAVDPAADFDLPRRPRRLPQAFLSEPEVEAVLTQVSLHDLRGLRDRAVLEVYYATGLRRMEVARLDVADIDLGEGLLTVRQGKNRKDRRVPIARRACAWVARYLRDARAVVARLDSGAALFLDDRGRRFREQQLTRLVSKYVKRAGIAKAGACNLFRHTTATLMHEAGADVRDIQEMLGHADISTTQVYTHVTIRQLREVYARTHPAAKSSP